MILAGGAAGWALAGVGGPCALRGVFEFGIGLAACGMLTLMLEYRKSWITDAIWAALAVWLFVAAGAQMAASAAGARLMARSFYGSVRVVESGIEGTGQNERSLIHGVIAPVLQLFAPAL